MDDLLTIIDPVPVIEDVESYQYIDFNPISGTNLNNGDIRINIESQDQFFHPSGSYLLIEGQLLKAAGGLYGNDDNITNNGIMYLFRNIRYELSGKEIENIFNPGQATTMLGVLKYPNDYAETLGFNILCFKDTSPDSDKDSNSGFNARQDYIIKQTNPKGYFSFYVSLSHIFGFCVDFTKVKWNDSNFNFNSW